MWNTIRCWFKDSETLVFARLQILLGILMATDLSPVLPAEWLPWYIIIAGVLTEFLRRARADDL